jgi:hypothetical protein
MIQYLGGNHSFAIMTNATFIDIQLQDLTTGTTILNRLSGIQGLGLIVIHDLFYLME